MPNNDKIEEKLSSENLPSYTSNIFEDLKDRLSSPFFSSFLISWVLVNWKIWIGLFWYTSEEIKREDYEGFIDFIKKNLSIYQSLIIPIIAALFYCFIYPYFRDYIKLYNAKLKTKSNSAILNASKEGHIGIMSYIKIKEDFKSLSDQFQKTIQEEKTFSVINRELVISKAQLQNEINVKNNDLNEKLETIKRLKHENNYRILNGKWTVYLDILEGQTISNVIIDDGVISDSSTFNLLFQIEDFIYSETKEKMFFVTNEIVNNKKSGTISWYFFDVEENINVLKGLRDKQYKVIFRKLKD